MGDDEVKLCEHCGSDLAEGFAICTNCQAMCERCNEIVFNDDTNGVMGYTWCNECVSDRAFWCERCDEYYDSHRVGYTHFDDSTYCEDCISEVAEWCDDCDEWETESCSRDDGPIHQYSYKPDPIFQGKDKHGVYLGWELEAELPSGYTREPAEYANEKLDGLAYLKQDGSLRNGFEIVTHPIAHNLLRASELDRYWDTVEQLRTTYGMRSWDIRTHECGLHVHVSKDGFSGVKHKHMFLRLVYGNPEMMAKFAGRMSRYSTFQDIWVPDEWGIPRRNYSQKLRQGGDRNSAVNVFPENTIEVRFFRGTLSKEGILGCLDLVHAMVEYTRSLTAKDVMLGALSWSMFYEWVHDNNGIYPSAYARMPKVTQVNLKNLEMIEA